jgi:type I restriction enzyme S subunit
MNSPWPKVKVGEVLRRSEKTIPIRPDTEYREVTVKLWGKGVVPRGVVTGARISASRRFVARAGQLILSRIDARNGAIGIVPTDLDGAVVTNDFPVFDLNHEKINPQFLDWLSKTRDFVELCQRASEGTTNRVRLQEDRYLSLEIPLPPLEQQRRIVGRIEEMAAKIEEARTLRQQGTGEAGKILLNRAEEIFRQLSDQFHHREFGSFFPHVTSGPRSWAKHYEQGGYRFYRAQDVGAEGQALQESKVFIEPPPGAQGRSAMLEHGDLMIVITGATVGRVTVFREKLEPGFVSQHVAICRLPADEVDPEFALWGLRSPDGQVQLLGQRYGQGKAGPQLIQHPSTESSFSSALRTAPDRGGAGRARGEGG